VILKFHESSTCIQSKSYLRNQSHTLSVIQNKLFVVILEHPVFTFDVTQTVLVTFKCKPFVINLKGHDYKMWA
jgi:hypothetical protein